MILNVGSYPLLEANDKGGREQVLSMGKQAGCSVHAREETSMSLRSRLDKDIADLLLT